MKLPAPGLAAALVVAASALHAQTRWSVDPTPTLTLGGDQSDTNQLFRTVAGATRLPDGRVLVGDRGAFSLHLFAPDGRHLRAFGRAGSGPGEFRYLARLLRCGDSVVAYDINGQLASIFSLDGTFARSFRFGSVQAGRPPYTSSTSCNARRVFAHHGWETIADAKPGPYRPSVPFWLSGADSAVGAVLGHFPGAERHGQIVEGRFGGSRPLPFGRHTAIAVASDRMYIGTADAYGINVYDFAGKLVATIRKTVARLDVTSADLAYEKEKEVAIRGEAQRSWVERSWAEMTLPKTLPPYAALLVDSEGDLWVQDFPRGRSPSVTWTVFSERGVQMAALALPTDLEVFEIGRDYILGRYLDPAEAVPQVRLYRLRRGPAGGD